MRLFYVRVVAHRDIPPKTWLVVAADEDQAFELLPDVGIRPPTVESVCDYPAEQMPRPGVIGWVGERPSAFN